jgi:hypothetical protein
MTPMSRGCKFLPETGMGTTRRVVEGARLWAPLRAGSAIPIARFTVLWMVPLPMPGRIEFPFAERLT